MSLISEKIGISVKRIIQKFQGFPLRKKINFMRRFKISNIPRLCSKNEIEDGLSIFVGNIEAI